MLSTDQHKTSMNGEGRSSAKDRCPVFEFLHIVRRKMYDER
jgi:hypothetical protein